MATGELLFNTGIILVFAGIAIIILATILIAITQRKQQKTKFAGAVVIGPIPIIFGSDRKNLKTILALSITLTALAIAAMIVYYLLLR